MPFPKGVSGNPRGRPKNVEHIRMLARTHTTEAINTLVFWMRARGAKMGHVSIAAANSLIERGWGRAFIDPDHGEEITITIRKILEGNVTVAETPPAQSREIVTIEHDATEEIDK